MPNDNLKLANEALKRAIEVETRNKTLLSSLGNALVGALRPWFDSMLQANRKTADDMVEAIKSIKPEPPVIPPIQVHVPDMVVPPINVPEPRVTVNIPEIKIPKITVPEPKVTVRVPDVKVPALKWPEKDLQVTGSVHLLGIDVDHPLPVQLRDSKGRPVSLPDTQVLVGGGGGRADHLTIKGFSQSAFSELTNADGRVKVELPTGSLGLTDTELRASSVPVAQASGAVWSVYVPDSVYAHQVSGAAWSVSVNDVFRTTAASNLINADDRLRVSVETGGSGLTDTELRASSVPVEQVSGSIWSVNIASGSSSGTEYTETGNDSTPTGTVALGSTGDESGNLFALRTHSGVVNSGVMRVVHVTDVGLSAAVTNTVTVSATDLDIRDLVNASDSISAYQVSGAAWSVSVNDAFRTTVASNLINADDRLRVSVETGGSGLTDSELRASAVPVSQVSGASWSVEATQVGTWTVALSGSLTSAVVVGPTVADAADDGNAPVQVGGVARTANPTAVAANDVVKSTHDDLGRQLMRPVQVRDLIVTAYVSLTNGTETTLLAATAGSFHDLIYLMGSNNSGAAVTVTIRPVTGGNTVMSLEVPANGTAGVATPVPYPQSASDTGNNWTADLPDITGTTVALSALFTREV